ncbi:MAG: PAS domain S-box protein [Nitrospinae bacterium]|nr:PAS domain S-box protein [Nitrospinota bacterium]
MPFHVQGITKGIKKDFQVKKKNKSLKSKRPASSNNLEKMSKAELIKECALLRKKADRLDRDAEESIISHKERAELETRFHAILHSANDAVIMTDDEGITTVWNQAAERIFGFTAEEMLGKNFAGFIIPEQYLERHIRGFMEFRRTGKGKYVGKTIELSALRKSGEEFPMEISFASAVLLHGRWHAAAIIRDITERKRIEEKLRQTMAGMEVILENAGIGIALVRNERFEWMNRKFRESVGYTKEEAEKLNVGAIFADPAGFEEARKKHFPRLKKGETVQFELLTKKKDGALFWGRRVVKAIDPPDLSKGVIVILEDFTERRQREEELRTAKLKAEEATKLKDKFVSLVAHDLRSPFASIMGFLRLIMSDAGEPLTPKQKNIMQKVLNSGDGLVKMIEKLLNISRLQTGNIVPHAKFMDGNLAAVYARASFEHLASEKGINIINEIPKGMRLYADLELFSEVIQNLVSNSIKFCKRGDSITLFTPPGERTVIAVRDNGIGIDPKTLPKLFSHEEKTSTVGTAGERGTGLGLPFCHDIMLAHGGSLAVESVKGQGSVFYARLPVVRPKVMVAAHEEEVLSIMRENFLNRDVELLEAENGEKAMAILQEARPHLVLADLDMPEEDGFRILKAIKENPETAPVPVITIASASDMASREKAFEMGADDFAPKPLAMEDFLPRVRRFIV